MATRKRKNLRNCTNGEMGSRLVYAMWCPISPEKRLFCPNGPARVHYKTNHNRFPPTKKFKTKLMEHKLDQTGIKSLRGINGSLQWLATNSRIDLDAKVSLSASETANPTIESLQKQTK